MPKTDATNPNQAEHHASHPFADYLHALRNRLHRKRIAFTRERLIDAAKQFAWIAPLTVLIWIYAEREQINPAFTISDVPFEITSNDLFVQAKDRTQTKVTLVLSGPQSALDKMRDTLVYQSIPPGLPPIDVGNSLTPGDHILNLADRIQKLPLFSAASGVSVVDVRPLQIEVNVETYIMTEAEVKSPPDIRNLNQTTTHYEPQRVTVRAPKSVVYQVTPIADITGNPLLKIPGPHSISERVIAAPPLESGITFTPSSVKAYLDVLDVRATDVTDVIPSVPVWVEGAPNLLDQFKVDFYNNEAPSGSPTEWVPSAVVKNIHVSGSRNQVDLALAPATTKWATLVVNAEDRDKPSVTSKLEFHIPGVKVTPEDEDGKTVEYRLRLRPNPQPYVP